MFAEVPTPWFTTYSPAVGIGLPNAQCNGMLSIQVLDPLIATSSTSTLTVSIFIRAGPDMKYFHPAGDNMLNFSVASGTSTRGAFAERNQADAASEPCVFGGGNIESWVPLVAAGEDFSSLRPLLKRYAQHVVVQPSTTTTSDTYEGYRTQMFQYPAAFCASAATAPWGQAPDTGFSACSPCPFSIIGSCFRGVRGGMRHKMFNLAFKGTANSTTWAWTKATLLPMSSSNSNVPTNSKELFNLTDIVSDTTLMRGFFADCTAGWDLCDNSIGPMVNIEVPYSANIHYVPIYTNATTAGAWGLLGFDVCTVTASQGTVPRYAHLSAIAEDTNFVYWVGCPPLNFSVKPITTYWGWSQG
jgi:hypothetical protein